MTTPPKDREPARDAVDRIREQWHAERPDITGQALDVWGRLKRGSALLDRQIEKATLRHSLSLGGFEVLAALRRSGPPYQLRPAELTRSLIVTPGTITNRLDQLEKRGFVQRVRLDGDRRALAVLLTKTGRATFDEAFEDVLRLVNAILTGSGVDQSVLSASMRELARHLEELPDPDTTVATPAGEPLTNELR